MRGRALGMAVVSAVLLVAGGCADDGADTPTARPTASISSPSPTSSHTSAPSGPSPSPSKPPALGTVPPPWLGTRVLPTTGDGYGEQRPTPPALRNRRFTLPDTLPMLPGTGFKAVVTDPAPAQVIARSTWAPGCPVGASRLSWIRLTFRGFDGERHTGELLVNSSVDDQLVEAFRALWDADFPMEQLAITTVAERDADPTGDGNGTGAFNCRPTTGGSSYSQHAYGLAVDVNPFQNPYVRSQNPYEKGDLVLPELATSYLDRAAVRRGMITPDGPVVKAFAAIGWGWGGAWNSLKDYQHFSQNDR
ncbi:M15 family metallopeptidase [Nocardioides sp. Soil796]|uniref:M15 family metallopeptidase n=1 Tax=Nocardioides sp. Soil796 TaxID=1736412 RepID=UPI0006FDA518|nr:M15 family metallopeptidase [Nocardioides sp. Soil796]KQY57262.1 hypothetical protein ASD30_13580 [Nocardioides sp. Root140]KRF11905.1 hypothetical protein ASH02_18255 [Nocardioides sp. Soil796]